MVWESVMELTKWAQEKKTDPLLWSIEVTSRLNAAAVPLPSVDLAHRLVSHIFWDNHVPVTWKLLDKAMEVNLVPPLLILALLSAEILPHRHPHLHPSAYALYLHLLNRHAFSLSDHIRSPNYHTVMRSVHHALRLSQLYPSPASASQQPHPGTVLVQFLFTVVWQLLEASLEDEGLLEPSSRFFADSDVALDSRAPNYFADHKDGNVLHRKNTATAIEVIARFLQNKVTSRILCLVHRNM